MSAPDTTRKGGADCAECEGKGELLRREDGAPMECWYCDGTGREPDDVTPDAPNDPPGYAARVRALEAQGLCTSDAQGVADMECFAVAGFRYKPE